MTSYEITELARVFLEKLELSKYFLERLSKLAQSYQAILDVKLAPTEQENSGDSIQQELQAAISMARNIERQPFFVDIQRLEDFLDANPVLLRQDVEITPNRFTQLRRLLAQFSDMYDQYIREYGVHDIVQVLFVAAGLYESLANIKSMLAFIIVSLQEPAPLTNGEQRIQLQFFSQQDLDSLQLRLKSFEDIYSAYCLVLRESPQENPLRLIKVETGSLLLDLLGLKSVVDLMSDAIRKTAAFVHRNHTHEGKRDHEIAADIANIERLINLEGQLRSRGINTSEIQDTVQKSSTEIAKKVYSLIGTENSGIKLNGERVSESITISSPKVEPRSGRVPVGSQVNIIATHAYGLVYFTTDGSDPRISDSRSIIVGKGVYNIDRDTTITAVAKGDGDTFSNLEFERYRLSARTYKWGAIFISFLMGVFLCFGIIMALIVMAQKYPR